MAKDKGKTVAEEPEEEKYIVVYKINKLIIHQAENSTVNIKFSGKPNNPPPYTP